MAAIAAADVKKLRDLTAAGMMECKKALEEADGDFDKAVEALRISGAAKAAKRGAERTASNGVVFAKGNTLVELLCETDFVAKGADFVGLAEKALDAAIASGATSTEALAGAALDGGTVAEAVENLAGVIGEKLELGRVVAFDGDVAIYLHRRSPDLPPAVGVLVQYTGDLDTAPVLNLRPPGRVPATARRRQLDFLSQLNAEQQRRFPENTDLEARLRDFETAARMQTAVPTAVDLSGETEATRRLYGMDQPATAPYGTRCLLARRLLEQGVRFVGVYLKGQPWDTHSDNAKATQGVAAQLDQPSAALVKDLKQRGLLDSTLVVWMGEFGRTPVSQGANGRDHSRRGFSLWLAGGGVREIGRAHV